MKASLENLRPMSAQDILDVAFRLYRSNFWLLVKIFAVLYLPVTALVGAVAGISLAFMSTEPVVSAALQGLQILLQLISFPLIIIALGTLTKAVSATFLGETTDCQSCYRFVLPKAWRLIGALLLFYLVLFAGLILCLIPGFIFGVWFMFVTPVAVLENLGSTAALSRSKQLVDGYFWKVAGTTLLAILIQNVVMGVLMMPTIVIAISGAILSGVSKTPPGTLGGLMFAAMMVNNAAVQVLVYPFLGIVMTLLYYDLRIRKEGFDLEMMAQEAGYGNLPGTSISDGSTAPGVAGGE